MNGKTALAVHAAHLPLLTISNLKFGRLLSRSAGRGACQLWRNSNRVSGFVLGFGRRPRSVRRTESFLPKTQRLGFIYTAWPRRAGLFGAERVWVLGLPIYMLGVWHK